MCFSRKSILFSMPLFRGLAVLGLLTALLPAMAEASYWETVMQTGGPGGNTGPIAYYRLNEPAGTLPAANAVNAGRGGSALDGRYGWPEPAYAASSPAAGVDGPRPTDKVQNTNGWFDLTGFGSSNTSAFFDAEGSGGNGQITLGYGGSFTEFGTENKTYSLWFKTEQSAENARLFDSDASIDNDFCLGLYYGRLGFDTDAGGSADGLVTPEDMLYNDGRWHHVVAVRNGDDVTNAQMFVDGVDVTSSLVEGPKWDEVGIARFGSRTTSSGGFLGYIDEVAVWDEALTPADATSLWSAAATPGDAPEQPVYPAYATAALDLNPLAYFPCNEPDTTTAGTPMENLVTASSVSGVYSFSAAYPNASPSAGMDGPRPSTSHPNGQLLKGFASDNTAVDLFADRNGGSETPQMFNLQTPPALDNEEMTYSVWIQTTSTLDGMRLFQNQGQADHDFVLVMHQGRLGIATSATGNDQPEVPPALADFQRITDVGTTYNDGQWHHVVAVRDGDGIDDVALYVDGTDISASLQQLDTGMDPWQMLSYTSARIGCMGTATNPWKAWGYEGLMDEIALWDRALDATEVATLFQAAFQTGGDLQGDLNGDGFVGGDDLDIVRGFWGQTVEAGNLLEGDPSGDGFVGGDDLDIVRSYWGQGTPPAPTAVPEPCAMVLLLGGLGCATMALRRRR